MLGDHLRQPRNTTFPDENDRLPYRLTLVVERAVRQSRDLQRVRQFMMLPELGNQPHFVGAADLFDRIKACNFYK